MDGTPIALAADVHWERAADLPPDLRDVVLRDDGPVLLGGDGRLWTVGASGLELLAEATPASAEAERLVDAPGRVGALRGQPARIQWHGPEGWSEAEPLPVEHATSVAVEADGTTWVAALFGQAHVRAPGGAWEEAGGLAGNLFVVADPTGGAWFWSSEGTIEHRPDRRPPLAGPLSWSGRIATLGVDAAGRPYWMDRGVRRDGVLVSPGAAQAVTATAGALWVAEGSSVVRTGAEARRVVVPEGRVRALGGDDASLWALGATSVWRTRPGPPLGLELVGAGWLSSLTGLRGLHSGDVDGDGLDDLVGTDVGGRLRVLRQEAGELVDRTADLVPEGLAGRALLVCDLDRDGRSEVLAAVAPDPPLRWLRWRSGALVDATAEVGLPLDPGDLRRAVGVPACGDLTGDGHADLVVPGGGALPGRLWLFAGDGTGHLREVALPARGLVVPGSYTMRLHPADLDGDGRLDVVHAAWWGEGHSVLRGTPTGWEDASAASGLRGVYQTPALSWLRDLDGDGRPDLLAAGADGVRAWAGAGDATFAAATERWGLAGADRPVARAVLADLDADLRPDLLIRRPDGSTEVLGHGPGGGFVDRTPELPRLPDEDAQLVALDLGGDGPDVIAATATGGWALRSVPREMPPPARGGSAQRAWSWTPWPLRILAVGAVLAWAPALLRRRLAGAGPWGVAGAALGVAATLASAGASLDAVAARAWPAALVAVAVPAGWWALAVAALRREAARVIGGYRLGPVLGEGASGTVFLARAVAGGEVVALKRLRASLHQRPEEREVFRREAEIGASIEHPHVVRILGWGEWRASSDEEPAVYVAMELLGGPTLADLLGREGALPVDRAAQVVRDAARGLQAVHEAGVVHRDVKPQNLAFTAEGVVKLMDFGAARPRWRRTETVDRFLGTLGYLAPERLRGETATVASDVYALGVVLLECLGGPRPDDLAVLAAAAPPARPARPDLPDALWAVVVRAMRADPAERFPDAAALAEALAPFAGRGGEVARVGPRLEAPAVPLTAHVGAAWALVRAYVRHARAGGAADAEAFAAALLARSSSAPRTRRRPAEDDP